MGSFAGLGKGVVLRNLHDGCTERVWSLNGGLECEGGDTGEFEKLLEEANERLFLRGQFLGRCVTDSWEARQRN